MPVQQNIFKESEEHMKKAIEFLKKDLAAFRTGRASPSLLEHVKVEAYGQPQPIKAVGNVSVPEPRTIVIQPWDKGLLGAVEKAIQKSDLGINPTNDGSVVRLVIPPLTEERRKDLVKQIKKRGEEARVALRNLRRDTLANLQKEEKAGRASEDEVKRAQEQVQKLLGKYEKECDDLLTHKEKEILEV
ncbi:MAG: ribosome recycling factor [Candidatus Xenobia bacterium]